MEQKKYSIMNVKSFKSIMEKNFKTKYKFENINLAYDRIINHCEELINDKNMSNEKKRDEFNFTFNFFVDYLDALEKAEYNNFESEYSKFEYERKNKYLKKYMRNIYNKLFY